MAQPHHRRRKPVLSSSQQTSQYPMKLLSAIIMANGGAAFPSRKSQVRQSLGLLFLQSELEYTWAPWARSTSFAREQFPELRLTLQIDSTIVATTSTPISDSFNSSPFYPGSPLRILSPTPPCNPFPNASQTSSRGGLDSSSAISSSPLEI